jgi:hypothetical protein
MYYFLFASFQVLIVVLLKIQLHYCLFIYTFVGSFTKWRKATISYVTWLLVWPSVHMEQLVSHWTDVHKIWYLKIFRKHDEKVQVSLKSDKNNWYWSEDQYKFLTPPHSIFLRMKNILDKRCRENQNKHVMLPNSFTKIVPFVRLCGKILYSQTHHIWQYGTFAVPAQ